MGEIVRLQKYIAMSGKASRRGAEQLIEEGRVSVNGSKVTQQGVKVEIGNLVAVDEEPGRLPQMARVRLHQRRNQEAGRGG